MPQLKKSHIFHSFSRDEGPFPCFVCKGIYVPAAPQQEVVLTLKLERNFRGWATILKDLEVAIHWSKASCPCNDSNVNPCINS